MGWTLVGKIKGENGAIGPIGPKGDTGDVGPIGPIGPIGPAGNNADATAAIQAHNVDGSAHADIRTRIDGLDAPQIAYNDDGTTYYIYGSTNVNEALKALDTQVDYASYSASEANAGVGALYEYVDEQKVAKTGDTMTGPLTVPQLNIGADTNLYRSAANTLKTDDSLIVGGNFSTIGDGYFPNLSVNTSLSVNEYPVCVSLGGYVGTADGSYVDCNYASYAGFSYSADNAYSATVADNATYASLAGSADAINAHSDSYLNGYSLYGVNALYDPDGQPIYEWNGGDRLLCGDGSNVTGLNASNIASGEVNKDRLPTVLNSTSAPKIAVNQTIAESTNGQWSGTVDSGQLAVKGKITLNRNDGIPTNAYNAPAGSLVVGYGGGVWTGNDSNNTAIPLFNYGYFYGGSNSLCIGNGYGFSWPRAVHIAVGAYPTPGFRALSVWESGQVEIPNSLNVGGYDISEGFFNGTSLSATYAYYADECYYAQYTPIADKARALETWSDTYVSDYPMAGDDRVIARASENCRISKVEAVIKGSGSVEFKIRSGANRSSASNLFDGTANSSTTGNIWTASAGVNQGDWVVIFITSATSTVEGLTIKVTYTTQVEEE